MAPANMFRNIVFVGMGIIKAILIVGIFMHLSYERKFLRWMIVIPAVLFISYLVALLLFEGNMLSSY
jgi:cytochrome c oxidase subunit IV